MEKRRMRIHAGEAEEENEKQSTDFREDTCCPSVFVQMTAQLKKVCMRGAFGVIGTIDKANSHFDPTQMGLGLRHHIDVAVNRCRPYSHHICQWNDYSCMFRADM